MKKAPERKSRQSKPEATATGMPLEEISANHPRRLRDELISRARLGEITPDEAERRAKEAGLPPLESQPAPSEYDPMKESRWTLLQAIAWIAWRDVGLVREQSPDYRDHCTYWVCRPWNEPAGDHFQLREGWFLEPLYPASAVLLTMEDARMRAEGDTPASARMSPREAEEDLWRMLIEERLKAEALDRNGLPLEVPGREWAHLKMFEEGNHQVLKYRPLDREVAFSEVRFKRTDLLAIWPKETTIDLEALDLGCMLDLPLDRIVGTETYVPFSLAICWVATGSSVSPVSPKDAAAWNAAVHVVLSKVSDGRIEVVGRDQSGIANAVPSTIFALIAAPHPFSESIRQILAEETYLSCNFFIGQEEWLQGFNDQLFVAGDRIPRWTHLQVRRAQVAKLWPKPAATAVAKLTCKQWLAHEMNASPETRPHPKKHYSDLASKKFKLLTSRQFLIAWDEAISLTGASAWSKAGRPKMKSNHRAS